MLAVWYDGSVIRYKLITNKVGFKGEGNETDELQRGPFPDRSIADAAGALAIAVYPNPARDMITIAGAAEGIYSIADVQGRVLLSGSVTASPIDIRSLANGLYLVQVATAEGQVMSARVTKY
ncbi:MAG: T9SS type A sorting domain-containing protein [Sphingobacteriales bacterium]|nr:MAG: T9SS type A sorting domain-containing protein [Sphingobacteriales bacterium]